MKIKTASATGRILDWAATRAAKIEGVEFLFVPRNKLTSFYFKEWSPSTRFEQGGKFLEVFGVSTECFFSHLPEKKVWVAKIDKDFCQRGPTLLVAGMRCLASVHFGEDIEVPEFLLEQDE